MTKEKYNQKYDEILEKLLILNETIKIRDKTSVFLFSKTCDLEKKMDALDNDFINLNNDKRDLLMEEVKFLIKKIEFEMKDISKTDSKMREYFDEYLQLNRNFAKEKSKI